MDKRQAEVEKLLLDYEKQCLNDLKKTYTEALADVKGKLRGLLAREETQSVVYQIQFQQALEEQLQTALDKLKSTSVTSVSDFLTNTYSDGYLGTIYSIQGQGIPLALGMDHDQVARVVNRKTDTMQFSQRLYDNVDKLKTAYKSQMSRGIASGSDYARIAKQLSLESEANYNQAMRIVRTEGGRVKSEAKLDCMKAAKKEGADIVKQWDATFDSKTRAEHRFLDGQIKEIDEPFQDSKGRTAQAPHKFGIASMDVNCRCIVIERARWAVEGGEEPPPNKIDNETGEQIEAKNYKEWKEKYKRKQAEQKPAPSNAKVFDKNSNTLPSVGDLFKMPNNDLVKIVEVNDFEGIKSVTLENGQTIVLGEIKKPLKITANNMPAAFRDSKRTATQTQKLIDYVNGIEGNDSDAKAILAELGKLENFDAQGINFKITYGTNSQLIKKYKYSGEAIEATLNIPKLDAEDITGAANTTLHELGHLVDAYAGTNGKKFGSISTSTKLMDAIREGVGDPSEEITALFKQVNADVDELRGTIDLKAQLDNINAIYNSGGFASYAEYSKAYNKMFKETVARRDYLQRNKIKGANALQDIYDALSGGVWQDAGKVKYGHGRRYYASKWSRSSEIFANYFSLSITRPDLVEVLRRDKPKLCEALDEMLADILKGVR